MITTGGANAIQPSAQDPQLGAERAYLAIGVAESARKRRLKGCREVVVPANSFQVRVDRSRDDDQTRNPLGIVAYVHQQRLERRGLVRERRQIVDRLALAEARPIDRQQLPAGGSASQVGGPADGVSRGAVDEDHARATGISGSQRADASNRSLIEDALDRW
jgi:hypothetical protein